MFYAFNGRHSASLPLSNGPCGTGVPDPWSARSRWAVAGRGVVDARRSAWHPRCARSSTRLRIRTTWGRASVELDHGGLHWVVGWKGSLSWIGGLRQTHQADRRTRPPDDNLTATPATVVNRTTAATRAPPNHPEPCQTHPKTPTGLAHNPEVSDHVLSPKSVKSVKSADEPSTSSSIASSEIAQLT